MPRPASTSTLAAILGASIPRLTTCALLALELTLGATSSARAQCAAGSTAGIIPAAGTGDGAYPGTLPTAPSNFTLNVGALPPGATVVTRVKLIGLTHSWINDVQFVLTDPSGAAHNIATRLTGSCDFNGDYAFVPTCTGGAALPVTCTGAMVLPPAIYEQSFGAGAQAWPSGAHGIFNTRLDTIPAATGVWTLTAYDWVGGDAGALGSFEVCFGNPLPVAPPAVPALIAPADLAVLGNPVVLSWTAANCAATFDVDIDGVVTTGIASLTFDAPPLGAGAHTWSVRSVNTSGASAFAPLRTFTVLPPPPPSVCIPGGAGGLVPAAGTGGGGVWPTTLPTSPFTSTYYLATPPGATELVRVRLDFATQHTWVGDLFVVLTDPTGGRHNILHRVGSTGAGVGLNCDLNGAYSIYESSALAWPAACPATGDLPPGGYAQSFGAWPSGAHGIFNTPLSAIPVASGSWTLTIYDWAGGDSGQLRDWQCCFDTGSAGPVSFCTAGTSTNGCVPWLSATTQPNVSNDAGCIITAAGVEGQKSGLVFYGLNNSGFTPTTWGAGTSYLCVKSPTQRTGASSSGGSPNACNGVISLDWDAYQASHPTALGSPFAAGDSLYAQVWYRDPPAPKSTNLSDALELTYTAQGGGGGGACAPAALYVRDCSAKEVCFSGQVLDTRLPGDPPVAGNVDVMFTWVDERWRHEGNCPVVNVCPSYYFNQPPCIAQLCDTLPAGCDSFTLPGACGVTDAPIVAVVVMFFEAGHLGDPNFLVFTIFLYKMDVFCQGCGCPGGS